MRLVLDDETMASTALANMEVALGSACIYSPPTAAPAFSDEALVAKKDKYFKELLESGTKASRLSRIFGELRGAGSDGRLWTKRRTTCCERRA